MLKKRLLLENPVVLADLLYSNVALARDEGFGGGITIRQGNHAGNILETAMVLDAYL